MFINFLIVWFYFKVIFVILTENKLYLPVKQTNLERDVRIWGKENRDCIPVY